MPLALAMLVPLLGFAVSPGLPAAVALLFLVGLGACYAQGLDALALAEMDLGERGRVLAVQGSKLMVLQGLGSSAAAHWPRSCRPAPPWHWAPPADWSWSPTQRPGCAHEAPLVDARGHAPHRSRRDCR